MSEGAYQIVQFGRQSVVGTGVSATTVFPVDSGFLGFELDRASESPEEDQGSVAREQTGRASTGVRWATASLPFTARYEDLFHMLEMHTNARGTADGTAGGTCTWTYTAVDTGDVLDTSLKPYTVEYGVDGSTYDEFRGVGVLASELELGFDALSAPGNSMWRGNASLVAVDRTQTAITGSLSAPATLSTIEGHQTVFKEGAAGTAFGSLSTATATLKQFSFTSNINAVGRAYGGSSDIPSAIGRSGKAEVKFDALLAIGSTLDTDVRAIFDVSGSIPTERRWRLVATGSGVNSLTLDARVRFTAVNRGEHDGEILYAVSGNFVKDSTLGGLYKITLVNAVTTIP